MKNYGHEVITFSDLKHEKIFRVLPNIELYSSDDLITKDYGITLVWGFWGVSFEFWYQS